MECFICKQGDEKERLFTFNNRNIVNGNYHKSCISTYNKEFEYLFAFLTFHKLTDEWKTYIDALLDKVMKYNETPMQDRPEVIYIDSVPVTITTCSKYDYSIESVKQQEETEEEQPKEAQFKRDKFDRLKQRNAKLASVSKFFKNF